MHPVPSTHGPVPEARPRDPDPASDRDGRPAPSDPEGPRRRSTGRRIAPIALVAVLAAGGGAATVAALDDDPPVPASPTELQVEQAAPPAEEAAAPASAPAETSQAVARVAAAGEKTINQIYEEAAPGVVRVEQERGQGSGFVIDEDGYIVSNAHVVEGADTVYVSFSNNDRVEAQVIGSDPATDVALLKVDVPASALTTIPLGSSADVEVGDGVVAIGNPFGLDRTVTAGIVSAISRQIPAPNGITAIRGAIQTDAAINHGNSGGPLLNMQGEVIGINSQIQTGGTTNGNVGVGFAVPVDLVKDIVADLREDGVVHHAWLGVSLSDVDEALAERVDIGTDHGAMVARLVGDGPAARSGLRPATDQVVIDGLTYAIGGDVIVSIDGEEVREVSDVQDAVNRHKPGDRITLGVIRPDGTKADIEVTLGELPETAEAAQLLP